jgi:hypothetical protein
MKIFMELSNDGFVFTGFPVDSPEAERDREQVLNGNETGMGGLDYIRGTEGHDGDGRHSD